MRVGFVEGVLLVMFSMFLFNVSSPPLMFYVLGILGLFCQKLSPDVLVEVVVIFVVCICLEISS